MAMILIVGKKGGKTEVLDEAHNKHEAQGQVDYWRRLRPGWRIKTKPKRR